jgi:2-polyprenyl-3-methyl-5-hydroxy-6-metoxy-1,4-benzoquinol methylase
MAKTIKESKKLWKLIDKISAGRIPLRFDFMKFACDGDPLKHLFDAWKPYYNLKYLLCKSIGPKSICEIGVRYGYSAVAFLSAVPQAKYTGIDNDSDISGGSKGAVNYAREIMKGCNAEIILADSQKMDRLPGGFYDMVHVDGQQDGDGTFHDLELALWQSRFIWVDGFFRTNENLLATAYFLKKYNAFIDFAVAVPGYAGEMIIRVKTDKAPPPPHTISYARLSAEYDARYFLTDCGGYDTFLRTKGMHLDARLENMAMLSGDIRGKRVLDVGCGRGELTHRLYEMGASAIGVDYSAEAVAIANSTFKNHIGETLRYLQKDILSFSGDKFDRILMADVVEHIEEKPLELLFEKSARLLNEDGYVIIHTAPNKLFYDAVYKNRVAEARRVGAYLPKNPRTYYEDLMHINEQTPETLRTALNKSFSTVLVWTAESDDRILEWMNKDCPYEETCKHNSIYAAASNSRAVLEILNDICNYRLERSDIDIEIQTEAKQIRAEIGHYYPVRVRICNNGEKSLRKFSAHPINLSYHVYDSHGDIVIWDGQRTALLHDIPPHGAVEQDMLFYMDGKIKDPGEYTTVITVVQEWMFWFDEVNARFAERIKVGSAEGREESGSYLPGTPTDPSA